jgi:adenosylcobinamide kinase/adenosylcobinamide-phosphate guanylyltransferase
MAERLVGQLPEPVTYVATASGAMVAADADMAARVAAHQARRPPAWQTVEGGETGGGLCAALAGLHGTVLIDALGPWVAASPDFAVDIEGLRRVLADRVGDTVIVSEEVGLGVHPSSDVGRRFRDALGEVNQAVAAIADEVLLVVAGRALCLEDLGPRPQPDRPRSRP